MSDEPSKCKIDLSERFLTCGQHNVFDPAKQCIICGKPGSKRLKVTSSDNGMAKVREVCQFLRQKTFVVVV